MDKKIILALVVIVLVAGGISLIDKNDDVMVENGIVNSELVATSTQEATTTVVVNNRPVAITGATVPDRAWSTFEQYVAYAKNHDIAGIKSIAHEISSICDDALIDKSKEAECWKRLDNIYAVTKDLEKANFSHSVFDNKQVIIYTDSSEADFNGERISSRQLLYFTIDGSGKIKTLGLDLGRVFIVKIDSKSKEEVDNELNERLIDTDQDTEEDIIEKCAVKDVTKTCVETNPKLRDTDGDGYWDSLEKFI